MGLGKSLDQLVAQLGERSRFQILLLLLVGCNYIPVVFNHVIMAFYGSAPKHHCRITAVDSDNLSYSISHEQFGNMTVLMEEPVDKCTTQLFLHSGINNTVICQEGQWVYESNFDEKTIVSENVTSSYFMLGLICGRTFMPVISTVGIFYPGHTVVSLYMVSIYWAICFDMIQFLAWHKNIPPTQWDLVCQYKYLNSLATTIYFSGVMIGGLLFGHLSDNIGRLPVLLITLYLPIGLGVGMAFVPSYTVFVLLRFFQGVLMQGLQTSSYVLVMEFFSPHQRPTVGAVMECFWGTTVMVLPGLAYLLPNWRHLQLAISLPSLLSVIYIWFVPESIRWLLLKGKIEKGRMLVTRMCNFNKIPFPKEAWESVENEVEIVSAAPNSSYNMTHLMRTKQLRQRSLVLYYLCPTRVANLMLPLHQILFSLTIVAVTIVALMWNLSASDLFGKVKLFTSLYIFISAWILLTIATGYFGLTFQITSLPGNKYINFFVGGLVELIAYALSLFVMNKFGRKNPLLACFLCAAVCCIIAAAIPRQVTEAGLNLEHISTAFAIAGRFAIAGLFSVIFVYTTELYPTVIRNIGIGTCTFWARLGGVIAPQINQLGSGFSVSVPILIFGCMMLVAGGLLLFIPETHNRKLPDTIADIENGEPSSVQVIKSDASGDQELMIKKPPNSGGGVTAKA